MNKMALVAILIGVLSSFGKGVKLGLQNPDKIPETKTKVSKEYDAGKWFNSLENISVLS